MVNQHFKSLVSIDTHMATLGLPYILSMGSSNKKIEFCFGFLSRLDYSLPLQPFSGKDVQYNLFKDQIYIWKKKFFVSNKKTLLLQTHEFFLKFSVFTLQIAVFKPGFTSTHLPMVLLFLPNKYTTILNLDALWSSSHPPTLVSTHFWIQLQDFLNYFL